MKFSSSISVIAVAGACILIGGAVGALTAQKALVEQIVHDYILQHPEIVAQAQQAAENQRTSQITEGKRAAIADQRATLFDDPITLVGGNAGGDVTIVEFFDYRCGYCKQVETTIAALLREDPGIRIIYKELPILGKDSTYATRVAFAARRQAKYTTFRTAMMAMKGQIDERVILNIAETAGVDIAQVKTDMTAADVTDAIARNLALAQGLGIRGTPGFVIGDEVVFGAIDIATMRQKIAGARGRPRQMPSPASAAAPGPPVPSMPDWRG